MGDWVDIDTPVYYACGAGARDIVIEPGEVLIAKLPRYNGNVKTECRLKFSRWKSVVYSNTFIDYIHEDQLTDSLNLKY
ncbi:MAG TPA: hypothetical protein VF691_21875 [Cytophagaceae bacterium]|jgi:hypothetical protein